jgi:hypothetical protein
MKTTYWIWKATLLLVFFGLGCHSPQEVKPSIDENADVRIEETPATAIWKNYVFKQRGGKRLKHLVVDGKLVVRESDHNSDGQVDAVRIRVSDGRFVIVEDTNYDGEFDRVSRGP